jgi:hypothetical protein
MQVNYLLEIRWFSNSFQKMLMSLQMAEASRVFQQTWLKSGQLMGLVIDHFLQEKIFPVSRP